MCERNSIVMCLVFIDLMRFDCSLGFACDNVLYVRRENYITNSIVTNLIILQDYTYYIEPRAFYSWSDALFMSNIELYDRNILLRIQYLNAITNLLTASTTL